MGDSLNIGLFSTAIAYGANPSIKPVIPSLGGLSESGLNPTTTVPLKTDTQPIKTPATVAVTPEQNATNKALAKSLCVGTKEDALAVLSKQKAYIDSASVEVKADLRNEVKQEMSRLASTDKTFMEKYGSAILLALEIACHGVKKYSAALWNKAEKVVPGLLTANQSNAPSDDRSSLIE